MCTNFRKILFTFDINRLVCIKKYFSTQKWIKLNSTSYEIFFFDFNHGAILTVWKIKWKEMEPQQLFLDKKGLAMVSLVVPRV